MSWQTILKIIGIPSGEAFLLPILVNRKEFENTINMLKQTDKAPRKLKATLANMNKYNKTHADLYEKGKQSGFDVDLSLEESKDFFDEMVKLVNEKVKEFSEREYLSIAEIKKLLQEAMAAKKEGDKDKVAEIVLKITEDSPKRRQFWGDNVPERDKLESLRAFLDESRDSAFLSFKNPPSTTKILEEFVKLLNTDPQNPVAELEDDKIYLDLDNRNDYIKLLQPVLEFYNENIRDLKPVFEIGGRIQTIDPKELEIRELNIRDAKFELVGSFGEREVQKYLNIIDALAGSKRLWKPTTKIGSAGLHEFNNGNEIPSELFVERGSKSQKSINLNPYADILLDNVFSGDWFKTFFDSLRMSAILTKDEAELQIIDDIYQALISEADPKPRETENYKINVTSFRRNTKIRNLLISKRSKKRIKEVIRAIISENQGEGQIGEDIFDIILRTQRSNLSFLEKYFSGKEATTIKSKLLEYDEDLETEMFNFKGMPTNNPDNAMYYLFEAYGEKITPQNIKDYVDEKIEETSSTDSLQRTLNELKERLNTLESAKQTEKTPANRKKQANKVKSQIKDTENKIQRLETVGGGSISDLRESLIRPTDFIGFVQGIASQQSINSIISQGATSAAYVEQINPKNALTFLAVMSERAGSDEIGEAFNKIDADPMSDASKNILIKLNDNMPNLIDNIKQQIIEVFKRRLQYFIDNYGQKFQRAQVSQAISLFESANMIREVSQ